MDRVTLQRVDVVTAAKVGAILGVIYGIVGLLIFLIMAATGPERTTAEELAGGIVGGMMVYVTGGTAGMISLALAYNFTARRVGGIAFYCKSANIPDDIARP